MFDPVKHLEHNLISRGVKLSQLGILPTGNIEKIENGSFALFTKECCEIMVREIEMNQISTSYLDSREGTSATGHSLANCRSSLPFTYQALTHLDTVGLISRVVGKGLKISQDYHAYQLAADCQLDGQVSRLTDYSSVPYPYTTIVKLSQSDEPPMQGTATILRGRLVDNVALRQMVKNNERYTVVATCVLQPADITEHEHDVLFKRRKVCNDFKDLVHKQDQLDVDYYVDWLRNHFA